MGRHVDQDDLIILDGSTKRDVLFATRLEEISASHNSKRK